jgi:type IV pilus assembly protein PilM
MPILGLDLGNQTFRAVEMEEQKQKIVLRKYASHVDPVLNLHSSSEKDHIKYGEALKVFVEESGFTTPNVVIPLPESDVFTRVVSVPQMNEKELKSSISYEAEQYIPIPIKDVNFDFQILDQDPTDKDKMNVLIVAARHSVLNKYVKILKTAGLKPKALEPESLAIGRILGDTINKPSATIILHIGATDSQIVVSYRGHVRFTRSVSVGGDDLTKAVEQALGFDYSQAEEYKKTYGLDTRQAEGKVAGAIKPVFDKILDEVKRSRVFYTTHNPNVIINRMIIAGGTALMPGLLFHVANNLDLEVELANPWRNIELVKSLQEQKNKIIEQGPLFVTAVGLALKELKA